MRWSSAPSSAHSPASASRSSSAGGSSQGVRCARWPSGSRSRSRARSCSRSPFEPRVGARRARRSCRDRRRFHLAPGRVLRARGPPRGHRRRALPVDLEVGRARGRAHLGDDDPRRRERRRRSRLSRLERGRRRRAQLAVNLTCIVVAVVATLSLQRRVYQRRGSRPPVTSQRPRRKRVVMSASRTTISTGSATQTPRIPSRPRARQAGRSPRWHSCSRRTSILIWSSSTSARHRRIEVIKAARRRRADIVLSVRRARKVGARRRADDYVTNRSASTAARPHACRPRAAYSDEARMGTASFPRSQLPVRGSRAAFRKPIPLSCR